MLKLHSYVRTNSTLAYKKAKYVERRPPADACCRPDSHPVSAWIPRAWTIRARKAAATGEAASQEPAVDKQRLDAYPKNLTLKGARRA